MFTGIIQELGTVVRATRARRLDQVVIHAPKMAEGLAIGESVAVNGTCLTVVRTDGARLQFDAIPETRALTTIGRLSAGDRVNMERSLTLSDRLNGHVVLGHVDGIGTIVRRAQQDGQLALTIRVPAAWRKHLVPKGSIAIDGVSLTIGARISAAAFSVFLVPETIRQTVLGDRQVGDPVNIELDYFAKVVAQFVKREA